MTDSTRKSFVESLDPRTKFVVLILMAVQMLALGSPWMLVTPTGFLVAGTVFSSVAPLTLLKRIRGAMWFVIFIIGINTFTLSGNTMFDLWGFYATSEGLTVGLVLSAKIILLLLISVLFVSTTSIADMLDGLETALRPFRKRFGPLVVAISITLNFVPLLFQNAQRIKTAQIARGADVDSGFTKQVRFAVSAMLPLFASAFRSSEQLAIAMEARCYDPSADRSQYSILTMKRRDWLLILSVVVVIVLTIFFLE